jgi:hypothetical protein
MRVVVTTERDLAGVALNTSESETVAELTAVFGPPTDDYMDACPYIVRPLNMRYVSWGSLTAVIRVRDTGSGDLGLVGWRYKLDLAGQPLPGGPLPEHIELPFGLEIGDPIGDAATATGSSIEDTPFGWTAVDGGHFAVEATGVTIDPNAPIDGVQQGYGYSCE